MAFTFQPSLKRISVEGDIVAEFFTMFDQGNGMRQIMGTDMVIQLHDDALPFYVNG